MKTKNIFRMLLVAAALLMGANNVKADVVDGQIWTGEATKNNPFTITGKFNNLTSSSLIRVYCELGENYWQIQFSSGNGEAPDFDHWKGGKDWGNEWYLTSSTVPSNFVQTDINLGLKYFDLECTESTVTKFQNSGLKVIPGDWTTVRYIAIVSGSSSGTPTGPSDLSLSFEEESMSVNMGQTLSSPALNNTSVSVTYSSGDSNVATVNATTGVVTPVHVGTTTITASFAGDDSYNPTSASYRINVNKGNPNLSFPEGTYIATVGQSFNSPTLNNPYSLSDISYYINSTYHATIDATTGVVTPLHAIEGLDIHAKFDGNNDWNNSDVVYYLTITEPEPTETKSISFSQTNYTTTFGEAFTAPVPTVSPLGSNIIYTSSNKNVALVINNTVVPVGTGSAGASSGETTITATLADDNTVTATYTLRVNAPTISGATSLGAIWLGEFANQEKGFGGLQPNLSKADYFSSAESGKFIRFYGKLGPLRTDSYWKLEIWDSPNWTEVKYSKDGNGFDNGYIDIPVKEIKDFSALGAIVLNGHNLTITAIQVVDASTPTPTEKQTMVLRFEKMTDTATVGDDYSIPTLYANNQAVDDPSELNITFTSEDRSIAKINRNTGEIELVGPGETTITAYFPENDTYNEAYASFTLTVSAAQPNINGDWVTVSFQNGEDTYEYRTFVTPGIIDLSRSVGLKAYYATEASSTEVVFTENTDICAAGVPLLLKKTGDVCKIWMYDEDADVTGEEPETNLLVAGPETVNSANDYVLTVHSGTVVFAETSSTNSANVDANHAYLHLNTAPASGRLRVKFSDESTGISIIKAETNDGVIYNLRGQRVENPTKGLYIINGKKVIIK